MPQDSTVITRYEGIFVEELDIYLTDDEAHKDLDFTGHRHCVVLE